MRIIMFGLPEFATICLETFARANKMPIAIVLPNQSHPAYQLTLAMSQHYDIPTIGFDKTLRDEHFIRQIKSLKPDLMIIASYPHLIPSVVYEIPPLGVINCHPSLLPQYRGPNPYYHPIRNGDTETGVTFHYIDETFDTGDIIYQIKLPIDPKETIGTLFIKTSLEASVSYLKIFEEFEKGKTFASYKQQKDASNLKYAFDFSNNVEYLRINWNASSKEIDRMVRAGNPHFPSYTIYNGVELKIYSGYFEDAVTSEKPGTISSITSDSIAIATGSGYYYPTCLQYYALYICDVKEFIQRNNLKVGEILN